MLLNESYFTGPLTIAQLGQQAVDDALTEIIGRVEPEVLQAALGYDLYMALIEGLDVGSDEEVDQKWLDLVNGVAFTNLSNYKNKWKGFKGSPLAGFVWVAYMKDTAIQVTGSGFKISDSENAVHASDGAAKIAEVHNQSVRDLYILWDFLEKNKDTYTQYDTAQINRKYFRYINQFGI
jgi:hypothetical protein